MRRQFRKSVTVYTVITILLSCMAVAVMQYMIAYNTNKSHAQHKIMFIQEKLSSNDRQVEMLKKNMREANLVKARVFAMAIANDRSMLWGNKLEQFKDWLGVTELHIIDDQGFIRQSTVDAYIDFDMASGAQSKEFLVLLEDGVSELVQDPQPNSADGTIMQYIGVKRSDAEGFVQVGVHPAELEKLLQGTELSLVLDGIEVGENGYAYALDASDGTVLAHKNPEMIGEKGTDYDLPLSDGDGFIRGREQYGYFHQARYEGMLIGVFIPVTEYYEATFFSTILVFVNLIVLLSVFVWAINQVLNRQIISSFLRVIASVQRMEGGDFSVRLEEYQNPEFTSLSNGINRMAESIRTHMEDNARLMEQQKSDIQKSSRQIENIRGICENLDVASRETMENAQAIHQGTESQEEAIVSLREVMEHLVTQLDSSADASAQVSVLTENTVQRMLESKQQMRELETSMEEISEMAGKIGKIIDDINAISQQTNMLSLNASIEAARAGEMGRGFSVVAAQVGELAARSSEAAKETRELIMGSVQAVEKGKQMSQQTMAGFDSMAEEVESASHHVKGVADMVRQNTTGIARAMDGLQKIEEVVEQNVFISKNSGRVSESMAKEASRLKELMEQE